MLEQEHLRTMSTHALKEALELAKESLIKHRAAASNAEHEISDITSELENRVRTYRQELLKRG